MSAGIIAYIGQRNAEAEAARVIGTALQQARKLLRAAKVDDVEDVICAIIDADTTE